MINESTYVFSADTCSGLSFCMKRKHQVTKKKKKKIKYICVKYTYITVLFFTQGRSK